MMDFIGGPLRNGSFGVMGPEGLISQSQRRLWRRAAAVVVATLAISANGQTVIGPNFNGDGAGWTETQVGTFTSTEISNGVLTLTDGGDGEARSSFFNYPQNIGAFRASFTYQDLGGGGADGVTFCLQNRGPGAIGPGGGDLAVGGVAPSAELAMNVYSGDPGGLGCLFATNGDVPNNTPGLLFQTPGYVDIGDGDPIGVTLSYNGGTLIVTMTDAVANTPFSATFSTNLFTGNLAALVGGTDAYVGFTGADGGVSSTQIITNFTFVSFPTTGWPEVYTDGQSLIGAVEGGTVQISATAYGGSPMGYQWQFSPTNEVSWTSLADNSSVTGAQSNVVTLVNAQPSSAGLYQLVVTNSYGAATSAVVSLTVNANLTATQTGLTWPASQYLPTLSPPAATIDCIDMDSLPPDQQALACSLEGIVNRTQPRIACVSAASEGEVTWLAIHHLAYDTIAATNALLKYETNATGLVVYDTNVMDTLNLATTIAGVKNELICDGVLLNTLTNPPYDLTVNDDLRGRFTNSDQVYGYLYTNYWSQCTHRIIAGMETNNFWCLRDYLIAVKSAVVWLDPGDVTSDARIMELFVSDMTPVGGIYLGWVPNEGADLDWIAAYGIPVMASDDFDNGSVYGGVASLISVPPVPPPPPLQNKVYVSITLSDGDNVQYMQHAMYLNWQSPARGTIPLGWTAQSLLADFDPGMLNYYWSTATTNDCLVAGPSGAGYAHVEYWSGANVASYAKAANFYLQRSGIRTITIWDNVSTATGDAYATNCPTLLGVNDQDDGYYTSNDLRLPVLGFPSSGSYASTASNLVNAITNTAANWNGSSPMFIAVQGDAWDVTPANCQTVASSLDPAKFVVVRPDQLFLLYQESVGLSKGGAPPYVALPPASQSTKIGANVTFAVTASGTAPLSYQWLKNGTNVPGATASTYAKAGVQLSDAGAYSVVVTNNYGSVTSSIAVLTFGGQPLGFNGSGLNWTVSENGFYVYSPPVITGNVLTLTDGAGGEDRSFFFNNPQYIGAFTASFVYQAGGNKTADGVAICIQNDPLGPSALGGGGGQLGVGATPAITPSIELELNLYTGNNEKVGYMVETDGLTGANGGNGNYLAPGNVQINSGDPIAIMLNYANSQMTLTFTDTVADTWFTTNLYVGNLTQLLGANAAYIGFTGADGGASSIQTISNFSFLSFPPAAIAAIGTNLLVSWPGGAPGYTLQENSSLTTTNWVNVTNQPVLTNELNQATVPNNGSNLFYRLVLPSP
ncbi:MAG TPA: immunoglobulin domain-containing protein [Verrucomicrobiae bacterium]|nr:immunoglobulin domain-containing protein [Verrucomicrobiae bacterium]